MTLAQTGLSSVYSQLLQLAIASQGENGKTAAMAILESEVGSGINDLALASSTVQSLVGTGTAMTGTTLEAFLRSNGSKAITENTPASDRELRSAVVPALTTEGIHEHLFPTIEALYQRLDVVMGDTFAVEATDVNSMKGTLVAGVQALVNGKTPITVDSLREIKYEGISLAQVFGSTADDVAGKLEAARIHLEVLKEKKAGQAAKTITLEAAKAEVVTAQAKLDAPVEFTLVDIAASNAEAQMSGLKGGAPGSTIVDKIAEMKRLEGVIAADRLAQAGQITTAVKTETAQHTAATETLAVLNREISDLTRECETQRHIIADKSALIAGANPTAKDLLQKLEARLKAGDVAGVAKLFTDNSATFAPVLQLQQEKTAAELALQTASNQLDGKKALLPAAEQLVGDTKLALDTATKIATHASNGTIKALEQQRDALKAEKFSFTGNELVGLKDTVPTLAADVDAKAVLAQAEKITLSTANQTAVKMQGEIEQLKTEYAVALSSSALSKAPFTLDDAVMEVKVDQDFLSEVVVRMTNDLTEVRREQEKKQVAQAIVLGRVMLEEAAASSKLQRQEFMRGNAALAALPMTDEAYKPQEELKALTEARKKDGKVVVFTGNEKDLSPVEVPEAVVEKIDARLTSSNKMRPTLKAASLSALGLAAVGAGLYYMNPEMVTSTVGSLVGGFSGLFSTTANVTAPLGLPSPDDFRRVVPYVGEVAPNLEICEVVRNVASTALIVPGFFQSVANGVCSLTSKVINPTWVVPYVGKVFQHVLGNGTCPVPSDALVVV